MSKKNTPRHKLRRTAKEQWIKKLSEMQVQTMQFIPDYAEGTDSNIRVSTKLQIINRMAETMKEAVRELLRDV